MRPEPVPRTASPRRLSTPESAPTSSVPRALRSRRPGSRPWARLLGYRSLQLRSQCLNLCATGEYQGAWRGREERKERRSEVLSFGPLLGPLCGLEPPEGVRTTSLPQVWPAGGGAWPVPPPLSELGGSVESATEAWLGARDWGQLLTISRLFVLKHCGENGVRFESLLATWPEWDLRVSDLTSPNLIFLFSNLAVGFVLEEDCRYVFSVPTSPYLPCVEP